MALLLAFYRQFTLVGALIALNAVFDRYDGRLARVYGVTSTFGKRTDTTNDLIAYAAVPMTVFFRSGIETSGNAVLVAILFFLAAGLRLHRFHRKSEDTYMQGLPTTIAGVAWLAVFFMKDILPFPDAPLMLTWTLILSVLMVTNIRWKKI